MNEKPKKSGYEKRNRILKKLGFRDYAEYLQSELWSEIRQKVIQDSRGSCRICGNRKSLQVHHKKYTLLNLSGKRTRGLVVLCNGCHYSAEFKNGEKRTLPEVQKVFKRTLRKKIDAEESMKETRRKLRDGYRNGSLLPDRIPFYF